MKVVYCINGIYNSGGMERVLMNKANYLVDVLGYEVLIVTSEQKGRAIFFRFSQHIRFIDLNINYDNDKNKALWVRMLKKQIKQRIHKKRLDKLLKMERPDICISMFDRDASFLYKIKDGSKKILEYHFSKNVKLIEATNFFTRCLQRIRIYSWNIWIQKYERFVVLTEEDKRAWKGLSNIVVIPNGVSFFPNETALLQKKRVLSIGRLCNQKGFERLIAAWKIVNDFYPDWQLCIYGDGDKRNELYKSITNLKLDNSIRLFPATSDIGGEYLQSSIYVMSSRYEGLPMVLLEAMSYGIPVVSFACPCGPKDVITHGNDGFLCENGNIERLADAILVLIADTELRKKMGKSARIKSLQFSQKEVMNLWKEMFIEITSANI